MRLAKAAARPAVPLLLAPYNTLSTGRWLSPFLFSCTGRAETNAPGQARAAARSLAYRTKLHRVMEEPPRKRGWDVDGAGEEKKKMEEEKGLDAPGPL